MPLIECTPFNPQLGEETPSAGSKLFKVGWIRVNDTKAVLLGEDGFGGYVTARVVELQGGGNLTMGAPTNISLSSTVFTADGITGGMLSSTRAAAFWSDGSDVFGVPFDVNGSVIDNVGTEITLGSSHDEATFESDPVSGYGMLTYMNDSNNIAQYRIYNLSSGELNQTAFSNFDSGGGTTSFAIMKSYQVAATAATFVVYLESVSGGTKWWRGSYCEFGTGSLANRQDVQLFTSATAGVADFNVLQSSAPLTTALGIAKYKSGASTRSLARITSLSTSPSVSGTAGIPGSSTRVHIVPLDSTRAAMFKCSSTAPTGDIEVYTVDADAGASPVVSSQVGSSISQDGSFNDEINAVKMSDGEVLLAYPASSSSTVARQFSL